MDERTLVAKVKWIEDEMLALKTAHLRGLGTADFCTETVSYSLDDVHLGDPMMVKVHFEDDVEEMPFVQVYNEMARFIGPMSASWDEANKVMAILSMCTLSGIDYSGEVRVVASAQIKSVTVTKEYV